MGCYQRLSGLALIAALLTATPAFATGYWNLPSNFCQCAGYGYGAGYHAPLVLGPISCEGWLAKNEVRLPYAPRPHCATYGCGQCVLGSQSFDAPTMLEPAAFPPAAPLPAPAAFRVPLRY